MYTIKRAAERAGVPVASLRAWERRYGVVHPARTDAGYRLYDDAAVERLRAMRALIADGWSASAAAGAVVSGSAPTRPAEPLSAPDDLAAHSLIDGLVHGARQLDAAAVGQVLDQMFMRASFELALGKLLFPAMRALGDAWSSGEVSVAGEHLVSQAVLQRLLAAFAAAGVEPTGGGSVVIGLPPGSQHEIGALAFATVCRRRGLRVVYLGANLPTDDWITASAQAAALVLAIETPRDIGPALETARAVRRSRPAATIALGGPAVPPAVEDCLVLADDLSAAAVQLEAALA